MSTIGSLREKSRNSIYILAELCADVGILYQLYLPTPRVVVVDNMRLSKLA